MDILKEYKHKEIWIKHGKDFAVEIVRWSMLPEDKYVEMKEKIPFYSQGNYVWNIYCYIYPKHKLFDTLKEEDIYGGRDLYFHGGSTYCQWHRDREGNLQSKQYGCDYNHWGDEEYTHIKNWRNVPIKRQIESEFKIPTFVENNINAMALAYKWLEFDGSCSNILFVSIRRGIRMSCILNNDLYRGKDNTAGEVGHLRVQSGNRLCSCGKKGCLETEASNSGIRAKLLEGIEKNRYKELLSLVNGDLQKVNIYSFVQSCLSGHQDSLELLDEVAEYIGDALSKVVILLNPDMIVLSGEITKCGDIFLKKVKEFIDKNAISVNVKGLNIERSKFGDNIGGIGAASIVMQEEFRFS
jgi:predicted NBD/HSP70 family sugar kinase